MRCSSPSDSLKQKSQTTDTRCVGSFQTSQSPSLLPIVTKTIRRLYISINLLKKSILRGIGQTVCATSSPTVIDTDGRIRRRVTETLPSPTSGSHGSTLARHPLRQLL